MDPLELLNKAIAAVPAVRYALGVAGIAAVVAIILGLKINPQVAVFGALIVIALMFVLLIFARSAGQENNSDLLLPAKVLVWFYTIVIMVVTVLFISSYFAHWPISFEHPPEHTANDKQEVAKTPPTEKDAGQATLPPVGPIAKAPERRPRDPHPSASHSALPAGSATVYNAFLDNDGRSSFIFDSGKIGTWDDKDADLGVSNPETTKPARFFLMSNDPKNYPFPDAKNHPAMAGIADMHTLDFDRVKQAPVTNYIGNYFTPELHHVYCVRTRDGRHYAKIVVTKIEQDFITFDYVYQPDGSRNLDSD